MNRNLVNFLADESGGSATEYALIAFMISVAAFVGIEVYGASLGSMFQHLAGTIDGVVSSGS